MQNNIHKFRTLLSNELSHNFLTCAKTEYIGPGSLYCGKWGKNFKLHSDPDLDFDRTMPNVQLVPD